MARKTTVQRTYIKFEKRLTTSKLSVLLVPVVSLLLALAVGAIFIQATGYSPAQIYRVMFRGAFGTPYALTETLVKTIPLTLTSLAVALAFRMRLWNIGAEGQLYLGAWGASYVALHMQWLPAPLVIPLMILFGCLAGGLWALLPAIPRAFLGVNETITTLLLNYVALLFVAYFVHGPWKDPLAAGFPLTPRFPPEAMFTRFFGTRLHSGLFLAVAAAVLVYVFLIRTRWGYEIRVIGQSPVAGRYAGMNIRRTILLVMVLSGALSGLAGMSEVAGVVHRLQDTISPGYGYTAIIVAWLAKLNPLVIVLISFLMGGLLVGGYSVQILGLPITTSYMIQGLILFFVLGGDIFYNYRLRIVRPEPEPDHRED